MKKRGNWGKQRLRIAWVKSLHKNPKKEANIKKEKLQFKKNNRNISKETLYKCNYEKLYYIW